MQVTIKSDCPADEEEDDITEMDEYLAHVSD